MFQTIIYAKFSQKIGFWACTDAQNHTFLYILIVSNIGMLGMYIRVFEDEKHDKACFKAPKPSCMPKFGQN